MIIIIDVENITALETVDDKVSFDSGGFFFLLFNNLLLTIC
jgi:hypothetical protein